jgi:phosphoribosylpyrophosphate synthetase
VLNKFKIIFCEKFYFSGIKKTVKDCKIFNIKTKTFTDGEYFIKIPQKIKKQKILIIHSLHDGEDFIKISLLIREVIKNDNEITLLIPYLGYCRNHNPNDSYTEIFIKSFLTQNVEKIILLEPHAKYVFKKYEDTKKIIILESKIFFTDIITSILSKENIVDFCFISPDDGAKEDTIFYSNYFKKEYFVAEKKRNKTGRIEPLNIPQIKYYKHIIIIDDIIDSGETITKLINKINVKNKNVDFYIFCTHAVFSKKPEFLKYKCVKKVIVANSLKINIKSKKICIADIFNNLS